ncbi:hypothetical protein [Rhizobium gallicum]|uniref:hypothetical protein n=1 Tax=Rhizobium gallicum TaxID=56730 RepID=UPI000A99C1B7|nr:hypothetical protein [Rhizobium gallicum]
MKFISAIAVLLLSNPAFASEQHQHHTMSPYTEETERQIKSLSETDIDELMRVSWRPSASLMPSSRTG